MRIVGRALIVNEGKVLLLKRVDDDEFRPGQWDFAGGGIERGETVLAGVCREIFEETGIRISESALREITAPELVSDDPNAEKHIFLAHVDSSVITRDPREHSDHGWYEPEEALLQFAHPFYGRALRYVIDHELLA
jgi:8-oxo-dGTP diphosphatase